VVKKKRIRKAVTGKKRNKILGLRGKNLLRGTRILPSNGKNKASQEREWVEALRKNSSFCANTISRILPHFTVLSCYVISVTITYSGFFLLHAF
jgi:hypothetical protein